MNELDIKKIREKLGISQEKLAEKLGVHPRTIQNWESGTKIPQAKYAILRSLMSAQQEGDQNDENGDNMTGNNLSVNKSQTDRLIDLLSSKEKSLWQVQEEVAAQRRVNEKSQEQIDRLLTIIESMSKN